MMSTAASETVLSRRKLAMLRAVAEGRAEILWSAEPDVFVDGLPCCDQMTAHELTHDGLIEPTRLGRIGERLRVQVTRAGWAMLTRRAAAA